MTPEQKKLARHALGLPNDRKQSYRNNFVVGPGDRDHTEWTAMVDAGLAKVTTERRDIYGGMDIFWLTRAGAEAAAEKGEKLEKWYRRELREDHPVDGDVTHDWHEWHGMTCCKSCGIVRRADRKNKPCKGRVHVALRQPS